MLEVSGEIRLDPVLQHVFTVMTVEVQARLHVAVGASQLVKPGPRCALGDRVRHDFTLGVLDLRHGRVLEGVVPVCLGRSDLRQNNLVDVVAERLSGHVRLPVLDGVVADVEADHSEKPLVQAQDPTSRVSPRLVQL
ncbi:unnamed protein product [Ectocarpus sp. 12 AP-2014]